MEGCGDFVKWLGIDMAVMIFMHLDDASDLVRACLVSSSWYQFVIANALCKQLCIRKFPEMSNLSQTIEVNNMIEPLESRGNDSTEWNYLQRNHRVYAFLARGLTPTLKEDCLLLAYGASSTDNDPEETIQNTLERSDRIEQRASYWSSKGSSDPTVPEALIYKLVADLCVVTEVKIQPFQAYFQYGFPIYSAKAVRFRMGHSKYPLDMEGASDEPVADYKFFEDGFIWTYTSPEFPMAQENCLQTFKLPQPVICIGGVLQVELLGRVQRQEMDGLYYICVSHVQATGQPLSPPFGVEMHYPSGKCTLKLQPGEESSSPKSPQGEGTGPSRLRSFTTRLMQGGARGLEQMIITTLLGNGAFHDEDDESESDEELVD